MKTLQDYIDKLNALNFKEMYNGDFFLTWEKSDDEIEAIFAKRKSGASVTRQEELQYKTAFMLFVGKQYHRLNWVMQLHYGCKRDNNTLSYDQLGPDTG